MKLDQDISLHSSSTKHFDGNTGWLNNEGYVTLDFPLYKDQLTYNLVRSWDNSLNEKHSKGCDIWHIEWSPETYSFLEQRNFPKNKYFTPNTTDLPVKFKADRNIANFEICLLGDQKFTVRAIAPETKNHGGNFYVTIQMEKLFYLKDKMIAIQNTSIKLTSQLMMRSQVFYRKPLPLLQAILARMTIMMRVYILILITFCPVNRMFPGTGSYSVN